MQRIARPDGSVRVLHSFCRVPARRAGEPARLHGFCLDVTERVRLEQSQAAQHEIALMLTRAPREAQAVETALRILREKLECPARLWTGVAAPETPAIVARAWREQRALFDGGFAFPVIGGGSTLGVIELGVGARAAPDAVLHELGSAVGVLLGEFVARQRLEQHAR